MTFTDDDFVEADPPFAGLEIRNDRLAEILSLAGMVAFGLALFVAVIAVGVVGQ